jgi:bifunctional oligoribonuclease and PAP phosphatase NrnA
MTYTQADEIAELVTAAKHVVVLQADNPDGDSLGSSLALEELLSEQGKQVSLYCSVDMPSYLHYLKGWDRVSQDLPQSFDLSIIVDASTMTLFEKLQTNKQLGWVAAKPSIVLDHHRTVEQPLEFAKITLCDAAASSTGEIIYNLAKQLGWGLTDVARKSLMSAILGDTQGLSNELASAQTHHVVAELIEGGVNRPALEEERREYGKMPARIFKYKAQLIERTEFSAEGKIATITIPQSEINEFSPLYNPAPLIQGDMLQTADVAVAIVFKQYDDGRVTGAIRTNLGYPIADVLAKEMGGGGHAYASGFKVTDGRKFDEIKQTCLELCVKLLDNLDKEHPKSETVQHAESTDRNDSTPATA